MAQFDNILAVDTSTKRLKLALGFGGDRLVQSDEQMVKSHGQFLLKKIENLFESASLEKSSLQALVVSLGPGSFTGLRIGLAAVKGMAVALDIPVVGVSVFDLGAYKLRDQTEPVLLVLPHRRDEFFVGTIESGRCEEDSIRAVGASVIANELSGKKVWVVGVEPKKLQESSHNGSSVAALQYDASDLLFLGRQRLQDGVAHDLASLEPMYLEKSQAEIKFDERHGKS